MDQNEYIVEINTLKDKFQKEPNDIHIWSSLAIEALEASTLNNDFVNHRKYQVPSSNNTQPKLVERQPEQVIDILRNAFNFQLYYSVFTFSIAQVEAFLNDLLFQVLSFDNRRLLTTIPGLVLKKQVELDEIISNESKESIIISVIKSNLISIFYASPTKQLEYIERITGVHLPESICQNWIEFKATRDLIVHNSGIINNLYIQKSGQNARGIIGGRIIVDKPYFDNSIGQMKSLIGKICNGIENQTKKVKELVTQ